MPTQTPARRREFARLFDDAALAAAQSDADQARNARQAAEREAAHQEMAARLAHIDRSEDIARSMVRIRLGVDPRDPDTIVTTDAAGARIVVNDDGEFTVLPTIPAPYPTEPDDIVLAAASLGTVATNTRPAPGGAGDDDPATTAARLGNAKSCVTPPGQTGDEKPGQAPESERAKVSAFAMASARRRDRMNLRDLLQEVTNLHGLRACERKVLGSGVSVRKSGDNPSGFAGVARCASVWACPTCSAVIRQTRATNLQNLAQAWLEQGHGLAMATFTVAHYKHAKLAVQIDGVADAWRRVQRGEAWKRFLHNHGVLGVTRAMEMTHGQNGWHVHLHVLIWFKKGYNADDFEFCDADDPKRAAEEADRFRADQVQDWLFQRWESMVEKVGLGKPDPEHGVRVDPARLLSDSKKDEDGKDAKGGKKSRKKKSGKMGGAFAAYLVKLQEEPGDTSGPQVGPEMARGDEKKAKRKGDVPFQIASRYFRADDKTRAEARRDLALWGEYESATLGRRMLTWSKGLLELLAELTGVAVIDLNRQDDEVVDLAEEPKPESVELAYIPGDSWRRNIAKIPGRRAAIIKAADERGTHGIRLLITTWGLVWGVDVLPPRDKHDQDDEDKPPPGKKRRRPQTWKDRDELANLADLTGLSPRDVVRPEQADRRMRGLPIAREAADTNERTTPAGPVCGTCRTPLADNLADTGHHLGCTPTPTLPVG